MNKKGQAAMEFLMTYGWAILVVLVAIGALAYFGVLNPSNVLPSSCTIAPGIGCDDFTVESGRVNLVLRNGLGEDLTAVTIAVTGCTTSSAVAWNDGVVYNATQMSVVGCSNGNSGDRFKEDITVTYTTAAGLVHTKTGTITGRVE